MESNKIIVLKQDIEKIISTPKSRVEACQTIIDLIPKGFGRGWKNLLVYELSKRDFVISDATINTFMANGYSKNAKIIIEALADVVLELIEKTEQHEKRLESLQLSE
jgi:hypothetical protein